MYISSMSLEVKSRTNRDFKEDYPIVDEGVGGDGGNLAQAQDDEEESLG
jgi:hypothetical protein